MFYFGEMPWHGEGRKVPQPLVWSEALRAGGLEWSVLEEPLCTVTGQGTGQRTLFDNAEFTPVKKRKALVRSDRSPGDAGRVLAVVHGGFRPLQNLDGARIFDSVFGRGEAVYYTGGYLGQGEKVWLLARLKKDFEVVVNDRVATYALFTNSHDGSVSVRIRLTTVRVVCENTLNVALREKGLGRQFRRSHKFDPATLERDAKEFWGVTLQAMDVVADRYRSLAKARISGGDTTDVIKELFPTPKEPAGVKPSAAVAELYQRRRAEAERAQGEVRRLLEEGRGANLPDVPGTLWALINAVTEFVDHHQQTESRESIAWTLPGEGMRIKERALKLIEERLGKVA
jgi:phage/plasmid-like protein (TIGR03299 family)